jgi:hypothetical protein
MQENTFCAIYKNKSIEETVGTVMMNYFDDNSVVHDDNSSTAHADSLLRVHDEQSQSALSFGVEKVPVALVRGFGN